MELLVVSVSISRLRTALQLYSLALHELLYFRHESLTFIHVRKYRVTIRSRSPNSRGARILFLPINDRTSAF